jgi:hypothetical protein
LSFLNRIFDRKTHDKTIKGYRAEQIKEMLKGIENVESFEYYYYESGIKYPIESEKTTNRPREEVLSFLDLHFTESLSLHTEIQQKTHKSGRGQIVLKGRDRKNEIIKLGVINYRRRPN